MDEKFTWTCDVDGGDFGGRVNDHKGIKEGVPRILEAFSQAQVKALFFISTEIMEEFPKIAEEIKGHGHIIGSHGHQHVVYKEPWRSQKDRELSEKILAPYKSLSQEPLPYRAPKFHFKDSKHIYSDRKGHVGLLKHMWLKTKIPADPIFYLHPFDIVGGNNPPNLFCRLWYSKPTKALQLLEKLIQRYPGTQRLL